MNRIVTPGSPVGVLVWASSSKNTVASIVLTAKDGTKTTLNNAGEVTSDYTTFRVPGSAIASDSLPINVSYRLNGVEVRKETFIADPSIVVPVAPAPSLVPAYAGTRTKPFDARHSAYNVTAANMRKTRAALGRAMAGTGQANFACWGDSMTANYVGNGYYHQHMWPLVMRDLLASQGVQIGGSGIVPIGHMPTAGLVSLDPRYKFTGTWNNNGLYVTGTVSGSNVVFTSTQTGTQVDVWYYNNSGSFTVSIDGGTPVAPTRTGAASVGKYTVTGLTDTAHTVTVALTSASAVYLLGVNVSRAFGLLVHNIATYSVGAAAQADTASTTGTYALREAMLTGINIDTIFLPLNDFTVNATPDAVAASITKIRNRWPNAEPVLIVETQAGIVTDASQQAYANRLYTLAETFDCPLIDMYDRFGGYNTASANGLMGDTTHPNKAGQQEWGRTVTAALFS